MIRGLDVSSCQGVIEWDKVPAEFIFIAVKVSEGIGGKDSARARNLAGARATGRFVMAYHFSHSAEDPVKQAENLWEAVGDQLPHRVAVDFETIAAGLSPRAAVSTLCREVDIIADAFGRDPAIYTYPSFVKETIGNPLFMALRLASCPLWMADYSKGETPPDGASPVVTRPWRTWTLWQTSGNNSSHVPGINGAVDHDVYNGDLDLFRLDFCGLPPEDAA